MIATPAFDCHRASRNMGAGCGAGLALGGESGCPRRQRVPWLPLSPSRGTPHDHRVAARHRSVQVHDDAGRPASFPRRAGRVPVQMPHSRGRPDAVLEPDRERDRRAVQPALHARRAPIPAALAFSQKRLRRSAGPVPARSPLHQPDPGGDAGRDRHRNQGAVAAHDPVRSPGARDRQRSVFSRDPTSAGPGRGPPAARRQDRPDQRGAGPGVPHRRLRHPAPLHARLAGRRSCAH